MQAFNRNIKDAALQITKALPGTSASNTSDTIDLGSLGTDMLPEEIVVEVSIPAIPAHVTTGNNVVIALWVGTTTTVAAPAEPLPAITITDPGVASTGSTAKIFRFKLPPGTPRYIGFRQTAGGTDDLSGSSITYSLLF